MVEEPKIRKRKGRCYEYQCSTGRWRSTGCNTLTEAKMWLKTHSTYLVSNNVAEFSRYIINGRGKDSFYATCQLTKRYMQNEWWNTASNRVERYIVPAFSQKTLEEVKPVDVQKWYLNLDILSLNGKKLADNSKNKILSIFSLIMDQAVFYGYIESNPCKKITKIRARDGHRKPFSKDELMKIFPENRMELMKVWGGDMMWACYFLVMKDTGWRPGEIAGLDVTGLYLDKKGIYTKQSVNSFDKKIQDSVKTTFSGGYDYRVGRLSDFTVEMLREYLKENKITEGLVFRVKGKRKVVTSDTARFNFDRALKRAGVNRNNRPPYALRTTFFTNGADKYSDEVLKELMGHTKWRSCYDQRSPENVIEKIAKISL